ncbi:HET-domain-containing protein, partial [Lepidopterella palustris CBS 459.81]
MANGDLTFRDFTGAAVPAYAILSHTWGADSEEVSFQDIETGAGKGKAGYSKISFCEKQAVTDGLQYFWIDTCCIDKRNSTELTKAINSMFRWYSSAARCYVYLSDVSTSSNPNAEIHQHTWEATFRKSRWFSRGWTLQELLAPAAVEFYSSQGKQLGDKQSLVEIIHEITGIPVPALHGDPLDTFSVTERMAWAAKRQTTEEEDGAYCLLGIFNIFMPLIYGEGRDSALRRLQREVDGLPTPTADTFFTVPFDRNPRFTGRESILASLEEKLFVGEQTTKMAIVGLGGIGKTQLALELAYRTRAKYKNCSVFWIPATDMDSLQQAYRDVAQQLRIPGWDEEKADVKKLVQAHLSQADARPWLCVFDNADDISMWVRTSGSESRSSGLKEYLPKSKQGCIVFTTRDKKTAVKLAGQNIVEVPDMDEDGAIHLLQKSLVNPVPLDSQDAKALVEELTYLPLAIVQAAAYLNENSMELRDYLSLLNEQEGEVIKLLSSEFEDDWRYQSIKNPVATTWLISFEQIRRRDPLAAEYLSFMACIDRKDIPQFLLPAGASHRKEIEAIGTLVAYSFIVKRGEPTAFDLHRLVHLASRNWLQKEGALSQLAQVAIERLDELFPDHKHQNRIQWRLLLPHAAYVLRSNTVKQDNNRRLDLAWKYAMSLYIDGRYGEAEVPFKEVFQTRKRVLGEEHPSTLTSMANLASTYRNQGRWKEAE